MKKTHSILFLIFGTVVACAFLLWVAESKSFTKPLPTRVLNLSQLIVPKCEKSMDDELWYYRFHSFVPLPDNIEDILTQQEFWYATSCAGVYVKGGKLCFRPSMMMGGDDSFTLLQFHPDRPEITLYHGNRVSGELYADSVGEKYADSVTLVAYDGERVLITPHQIKSCDSWWSAFWGGKEFESDLNYEAAYVDFLTPLSCQECEKFRLQIRPRK